MRAAAVALYAFGLLALNAGLLYKSREAILKQKPTPLSKAIRFLYREYGMLARAPLSNARSGYVRSEPRVRALCRAVGILLGAVRDGEASHAVSTLWLEPGTSRVV